MNASILWVGFVAAVLGALIPPVDWLTGACMVCACLNGGLLAHHYYYRLT